MKKSIAFLILTITGLAASFAQQHAQQAPQFTCGGGTCSGSHLAAASDVNSDRNGNNSLGPVFNQTACGLNYVTSSRMITTRYTSGPGSGLPSVFPVTNVPPCTNSSTANIIKVYAWWGISYQSGSSTTPTITITNPNSQVFNYTATMAGQSGPKCWGEIGTRTFRADITTSYAGNGNYTVNVTGNTVWEIDGMTIVIVYRDPAALYEGTLVIYDGCWAVLGGPGINQQITGFNACANAIFSDGFNCSGDMQNNISPPFHQGIVNNTSVQFPNTFWNCDRAACTLITSGQTSATVGLIPNPSDCYTWNVAGVYYQTMCNTCIPPSAMVVEIDTNTIVPSTCNMSNGAATVNVISGGQPPFVYSWNTVPPQNTQTAINLAPGTYVVQVTDGSGCNIAFDTVTIISVPPYTISTTTIDLNCFNDNSGSATVTTSGNGTPPYTYQWSSTPVQTTATASGLPAGVYTVTVSDATNCNISTTVTLNEPPQLTVNIQNVVQTLCGFNNGSAEAVGAGGTGTLSYSWNTTPVQTTAIATNMAPGLYTVVVTDAHNCTVSATVTINPSSSPVVTPVNLGSNPLCITQSTQLDATVVGGTPPYTYNWTPGTGLSATNIKSPMANPIITTTYSVDVTDVDGCTSQPQNITIDVYQPLTVVGLGNTAICSGATVNIAANAGGGDGNYLYMWNPVLPNSPGPHAVSPGTSTTYNVIVTDGCGSPAVTASVVVVVSPTPVVNIQGAPLTGCSPLAVQFTDASIVPAPGIINQWIWLFGDNAGSNLQNPVHTYMDGGVYTVQLRIITTDGCTAVDSVQNMVTVQQTPIASFYPDPKITTIFTPDIAFNNTSLYYTTSMWDFGDGGTSGLDNPTHTYGDTGKYLVTLIVTESSVFQCSDTALDYVVVNPNVSFYAPNVFSPNGDGVNETFYPLGEGWDEGPGSYQMYIYNRWGEVIFKSTDKRFGWDGKMPSGKATPGVYVYMFIIKDLYGKEHQYLGSVALIR